MGYCQLLDDLRTCRRTPVDELAVALVDRTASTNSLARALATACLEEGLDPPPLLLVACEQTAGRGRQGRPWASPRGVGVYATLLLGRRAPSRVALLPLQVGVGLAHALNRVLPAGGCRLKWPNDLVTSQGKLGGVLIEVMGGGPGGVTVLVGFGVNRGGPGSDRPSSGATSLFAELGEAPPSLGDLAWRLAAEVLAELGRGTGVIERYRELSAHRDGDEIAFRLDGEAVRGVFRGFDERGFLLLERQGRCRPIAAGEVIEG
jgi:BirA family biotin operon repressor/biotin-[acetyl-CoA-carboxylase] ligase